MKLSKDNEHITTTLYTVQYPPAEGCLVDNAVWYHKKMGRHYGGCSVLNGLLTKEQAKKIARDEPTYDRAHKGAKIVRHKCEFRIQSVSTRT